VDSSVSVKPYAFHLVPLEVASAVKVVPDMLNECLDQPEVVTLMRHISAFAVFCHLADFIEHLDNVMRLVGVVDAGSHAG
jgi:hypothetical protein